jgi:hypothetical protein
MKFARNPRVLWDSVDGTLVLCHTDTVQFYELNRVGAFLWRACEGADLDTVIGLLAETYPQIDPARLADDARSYFSALVNANLLCPLGEE